MTSPFFCSKSKQLAKILPIKVDCHNRRDCQKIKIEQLFSIDVISVDQWRCFALSDHGDDA